MAEQAGIFGVGMVEEGAGKDMTQESLPDEAFHTVRRKKPLARRTTWQAHYNKKPSEKEQNIQEESTCPLSVLVIRPFPGPLTYLASAPLPAGTLVRVPLGRGDTIGCVWDEYARDLPPDLRVELPPPPEGAKLRFVQEIIADIPPLPVTLRNFIDWVAAYTLSAPGLVLAMAARVPSLGGLKPESGWVRVGDHLPEGLRLTPARRAVLAVASSTLPRTMAFFQEKTGASAAVVRGLAASGALRQVAMTRLPEEEKPDPDHACPVLSENQERAAAFLRHEVEKKHFSVTLLEGVTGSGKTEVYFEAIASALRQNQQVLVLLPEIALTTQWTERFTARFGVLPALWHSELGQKKRRETWCAIAGGQARVVIGARSALFLPFITLGLVIVDEEHEASFKQEEGVTYHGRDMAVMRGRLDQAPVVLVSATPSMESLANVTQKRYHHLTLEERHGGADLPETRIIDMRQNGPERGFFLSPILCEAVEEALQSGEQALLFLNRRGYAPLTLCRACGHRLQCPNCSAWLVEHRARHRLACHHCDYSRAMPSRCSECQAEDSLVPIGPGVERIREEAESRFPQARLLVMATDTMSSPQLMEDSVRQIASGDVNLIIGTQMVAKGWHFPSLTLVGVVDADLGLGGGDLRAAERTMQLLHQVSGRAGRGKKPGRVFLQSYVGEHPVMQALQAHDFQSFMEQEAAGRRPGFWPPYGRLAALIVSAPKERQAESIARQLAVTAPRGEGIQVLGPTPAPLALLRGRYRQRLLLRTKRGIALQPLLRQWLALHKPAEGARIDVDVDPISFM